MSVALVRDERGAVYVEFIIAFMPVFFMFLAIVQAAMVFTAQLVVHQAATAAARSAAVVIGDDPRRYGGTEVGHLDAAAGTGTDGNVPHAQYLAWANVTAGPGSTGSGNARLQTIRNAAAGPLFAISPTATALGGGQALAYSVTYGANEGPGGALQSIPREIEYTRYAMAVSLVEAASSDFHYGNRSLPRFIGLSIPANENLIVRVTYLYYCGVPIVNRLTFGDSIPGLCQSRTEAQGALTELGEQGAELDLPPEYNGTFKVIRAEATFPNQGAVYAYGQQVPP